MVAASVPSEAQTGAALDQVIEGFGRGQCDALTHQALDPTTRQWMTIDPSPWDGWVVKKIGPRALEYVRSGDEPRLMEFADGVYRDRAPNNPSDSEEWEIIEYGIHSPDNWRILMTPPEFDETAPVYAELIVVGNVFMWVNWADQPNAPRLRVMHFSCRFVDG